MSRLVYLASPYFHTFKPVMMGRYYQTAKVTAQLIERGIPVFSPIVHCHHLKEFGMLTVSEETMRDYDLAYVEACTEVWVLQITGWDASEGVRKEMDYAIGSGKTIRTISVDKDSMIVNWSELV